ncbi:MAG TPA: polysaccharide lyase family 1 protein [Sandaracinaceae bacterium LLY-WYZ-13_1]|nr:polysaccharide lyase family 1 protein [Sandaracinaceae bacterium LLY-WYZ-13_1]
MRVLLLCSVVSLTACDPAPSGPMTADTGPGIDARAPVGTDGGRADTAVELPDASVGEGADGGPADGGVHGPVDCTPIGRSFDLCEATADRCAAVYRDGEGCDAVCAVAGLVCVGAHEDVSAMCAPDLDRPALGCDSGHRSDYCLCARDPSCMPDCAGRSCGGDGCGGRCGTCGPDMACDGGACVESTVDCSSYPYDPVALRAELIGYGRRASGGDPSRVYTVTNTRGSGRGSLRRALESSEPYWIVFDVGVSADAAIDLGDEPVDVASNKTIDGRGRRVTVDGAIELRGARNVIFADVAFTNTHGDRCTQEADVFLIRGDGADHPGGFENRDIWFHHVEVFEGGDGLIDVRGGSRITISWSHFHDHGKGMLLSQGSAPDIEGREMEVTFHHNFFERLSRRGPRQNNGRVHYFNNYMFEWWEYGVAVVHGAQFRSENNVYQARPGRTCGSIFSPCRDPAPCGDTDYEVSKIAVSDDWAADTRGYVASSGDLLLEDATVAVHEPDRVFTPSYAYVLEPATMGLASRIRADAGPRTTYCR